MGVAQLIPDMETIPLRQLQPDGVVTLQPPDGGGEEDPTEKFYWCKCGMGMVIRWSKYRGRGLLVWGLARVLIV